MRVGWYVHHHGSGHRTRALLVGSLLARRGAEVTLLGSDLDEQAVLAAGMVALSLARDDSPADDPSSRGQATARGLLHWAPLRHDGFTDRMTTIAQWVRVHRPDVLVVDVSCEVTLLARLLGVPVIVVGQPGLRTDAPHTSALAVASAVLAPWPDWATAQLLQTGPDIAPVVAVGGLAASSVEPAKPQGPPDRRADGTLGRPLRGLILSGSEGFDRQDLPEVITRAVPEIAWTVAGGRVWVNDVNARLAESDVVVMHAGQNAVADVAAAGVAAVVVPQQRPHAEQERMARVLTCSGLATVVHRDEVATCDWAGTIAGAASGGGRAWERWECHGAVERAADVVESICRG